MANTGNLPDYDALIKSDPTLYQVGSDITFHCQITLDKEQREQYRPLVDELNHDTLIPCLERALVKILRQWSDIRDDNISLEALCEAAIRKANTDARQNLARAKKIYGSITDSIRRDQRELEGVVQVAAAVVSGYLRAEPAREKEIILWMGNSFVFHALDYLGHQLERLKPQIKTRLDHHDKEVGSQNITLFLPLSAANIRWFTKKYDRQTKKLTDTVSTEYHHFMDEINKGQIDSLLRDIAAKNATIRVISDDVEARIWIDVCNFWVPRPGNSLLSILMGNGWIDRKKAI